MSGRISSYTDLFLKTFYLNEDMAVMATALANLSRMKEQLRDLAARIIWPISVP